MFRNNIVHIIFRIDDIDIDLANIQSRSNDSRNAARVKKRSKNLSRNNSSSRVKRYTLTEKEKKKDQNRVQQVDTSQNLRLATT